MSLHPDRYKGPKKKRSDDGAEKTPTPAATDAEVVQQTDTPQEVEKASPPPYKRGGR